jgi:hypothetical protein
VSDSIPLYKGLLAHPFVSPSSKRQSRAYTGDMAHVALALLAACILPQLSYSGSWPAPDEPRLEPAAVPPTPVQREATSTSGVDSAPSSSSQGGDGVASAPRQTLPRARASRVLIREEGQDTEAARARPSCGSYNRHIGCVPPLKP